MGTNYLLLSKSDHHEGHEDFIFKILRVLRGLRGSSSSTLRFSSLFQVIRRAMFLANDSAASITQLPITNYQFQRICVGVNPIDHPCVLTIFAGSVNFASPTSSVTV
jgi:hypothetical protein